MYRLSADLDQNCIEDYADVATLSVFESIGTSVRNLPLCLSDCDSASVRELFEKGEGNECFRNLETTSSANAIAPGSFDFALGMVVATVSMVLMYMVARK